MFGRFDDDDIKDFFRLAGTKILGLHVNSDQSILRFETDRGNVDFHAVGDCCSESWFADITGVDALLNATVRKAEAVEMDGYNTADGRCRQDEDKVYGVKITTDKGYTDVVFRNSSNGYYGGWLTLGEDQYGHPRELDPDDTFTAIYADWHA